MDGFVSTYREEKENRKFFNFVLEKFPQIKNFGYAINPKGMIQFMIWIFKTIMVKVLMEEMDGLQFKLVQNLFFQTNYKQALELYRKTIEFAEISENDVVYDLYTGTGTIANILLKKQNM